MIRLWLYVLLIGSAAVAILLPVAQRSVWNKNRLYQRLLTGNPRQQLEAASTLVYVGGQDQLLRALQSGNASARELGRRALEHLWFNAAGEQAYQLMESAWRSSEQKEFQKALKLLNQLVSKYPTYAEGWNQRASVFWELGEYEKSMADSERALLLNPHHYGAWQGLGICHMQLGNFTEACRCLRAALKIIPHDAATRETLQRCEERLRVYPVPSKWQKPLDLVQSKLGRGRRTP